MGRRRVRGIAVAIAAVALLAVAGSAIGAKKVVKVHIQAGNLIVDGEGGFTPTALSKTVDTPITLFGKGKISTVDGELPPVLHTIEFEFDKHGSVDTTGLPKCSLEKTDRRRRCPQARKLCPGSIVGTGYGHGGRRFPRTGADQGRLADHPLQRPADRRRPDRLRARLPHGWRPDHVHRPDPDRRHQQRPLRLPGQRRDPEDRRRLRHPDLRLDPGRPQMDLQGQEAQLRQRPLRRRPPAGDRRVRLQRRHPDERHLPQPLPGSRRLSASRAGRRLTARPSASSGRPGDSFCDRLCCHIGRPPIRLRRAEVTAAQRLPPIFDVVAASGSPQDPVAGTRPESLERPGSGSRSH